MVQRHHDDALLWDSALALVQAGKPDLAVSVLRKAIEGSFAIVNQSSEFLNRVTIKTPTEKQIHSLKAFDAAIQQAVKNGHFEEAGDRYTKYLETLLSIFEEGESAEIQKMFFGQLLKTSYQSKEKADLAKEQAATYTTGAKVYTTTEAAEMIHVSDQTIRRMCEKGKFPGAYKTDGGHWRVPSKYFKITPEEARIREEGMASIDRKTKEMVGKDIDEFNV
jgi:excisionase family DNA binding protein